MYAAWPLKRTFIRPWFQVMARVGPTGNYENFLDPGLSPAPDDLLQERFRPRNTGELFVYVNDAGFPVPGLYDLFYRNNAGEAVVTVQKL